MNRQQQNAFRHFNDPDRFARFEHQAAQHRERLDNIARFVPPVDDDTETELVDLGAEGEGGDNP